MSYFTRKQVVTDLAEELVLGTTGTTQPLVNNSLQAWDLNLQDIADIDAPTKLGRVLFIPETGPLQGRITTSDLGLGTAAFIDVGTAPGEVVIVQDGGPNDGFIDPGIIPPTASVPSLWGDIELSTIDSGQVAGNLTVSPGGTSDILGLVAGDGITLTGDDTFGNKAITINVISENKFTEVAGDIGTAIASVPSDLLTILGGVDLITEVAGNVLTIDYTGKQFTTLVADSGLVAATTNTDTVTFEGGTNIDTTFSANTLNISYNGIQWTDIFIDQFNFNIDGDPVQSPVNSNTPLNLIAGVGIFITNNDATNTIEIRKWDLEPEAGDIDGKDYGTTYLGFTYDGGTYFVFDGGTY